jgi:hypothetical protein
MEQKIFKMCHPVVCELTPVGKRPNEVWQTADMRYDGATFITTFGVPLAAQVHRESAGGPLATRPLRSLIDIRGRRVPFVNDCLPVVLAMQKGSSSLVLQADAEYMARTVSPTSMCAALVGDHDNSLRCKQQQAHRTFRF